MRRKRLWIIFSRRELHDYFLMCSSVCFPFTSVRFNASCQFSHPLMIFIETNRNRAAMFVANHNAWMDIPFVGVSLGFRNYKMISKVELSKVPILGRSIKVGGHVMVDRTNRRSQLMTLKSGMQWLKVCLKKSITYSHSNLSN